MDIKAEILAALKRVYKNAALTKKLDFEYKDSILYMKLNREAVGFDYYDANNKICHANMQEDRAAFEGWAAVIKTYWNNGKDYKIQLCVPSEKNGLPSPKKVFLEGKNQGISQGHYGRFLYRAGLFANEYEWFELSKEIMDAVSEYNAIIASLQCRNHLPDTEAGVNHHPEIQAEVAFHKHPEVIEKLTNSIVKGSVYRQLNCWLESADGKIQFLTSGRSAIDLWNVTGKTLNIFELKASSASKSSKSRNYKVGIISELFLYAEYCNDMFAQSAVFDKRPYDGDGRGYGMLSKAEIDKINAYYLTNHYHPLLTEKVVELLNKNKSGINYIKLPEYDYNYLMSLN